MANYYQQISGGIRARDAEMRRIQQENDAIRSQKEMDSQRKNILQQYFQPATPDRQEI